MKRTLANLCLALVVILPLQGCGTLLYGERQHQPHSEKLDPNVLILDGLGLLLFIVPGLVAFGVDFHTGAIYLPHDASSGEVTPGREADKE